jgi:phosphopantothenoylcysteine decarboxylase/phosphopantothenate--cysteine ligase
LRVVLGVTGGIAAYKVAEVIREFKRLGHSVTVVPTANALKFIGKATLEALSGESVSDDVFTEVESVKHVAIGQQADLVVVAPATASFLARLAVGLSEDLLGTTLLATTAPILLAPAMHSDMWNNQATQANVSTLRGRGVTVLTPDVGELTSGDVGIGRLPDSSRIVAESIALTLKADLKGKNFLVTTGGTRAPIDAARFLGNFSSGKQGIAIAKAAQMRGANVTLIAANVTHDWSINPIPVTTNAELESEVLKVLSQQDVLIMAAAVADFETYQDTSLKMKRTNADVTLTLKPAKDLLAGFAEQAHQRLDQTVVVGFAAETLSGAALVAAAQEKLQRKDCDLVVANDVSNGKVFGDDATEVVIISRAGLLANVAGSKLQIANTLLDEIVKLL